MVNPIIGLILLLPLGLVVSCDDPAHQITAQQLFAEYNAEYEANQLAAEKKYKGRTLLVTGVVADIGRDYVPCRKFGICEGNPYITLSAGQFLGLVGVKCKFPEKEVAGLVELTKGQSATVKGKFEGKEIFGIELSGCALR